MEHSGNEQVKILASLSAKSLQLCPTLCHPIDYSPPGSSVHGILQARILEWFAMPSSRGSSWPRDRTRVSWVSCIGRWVLYRWTTWGVHQSGSSSNLVQEFIEFNLYFLSTPSFPSQRLVGGTEISNLLITWSLRWQTLPTLRLSGLRSPQ